MLFDTLRSEGAPKKAKSERRGGTNERCARGKTPHILWEGEPPARIGGREQ